MKAPGSANLDRVQIVKGWTKNGEVFERVYDVAWSGDRTPDENAGKLSAAGNTVGVATATYENAIGSISGERYLNGDQRIMPLVGHGLKIA